MAEARVAAKVQPAAAKAQVMAGARMMAGAAAEIGTRPPARKDLRIRLRPGIRTGPRARAGRLAEEGPGARDHGQRGVEMLRVGMGYDIHGLAEGRKLLLGCVEIPHEKGLKGHSDGDVLVHAMIDAIFGACNLGDIGTHFPDTAPEYKGISGEDLLGRTRKIVEERGRIEHIDSTVVVEAPRLADHIPDMKQCIADALGVRPKNLNQGEDGRGPGRRGQGAGHRGIRYSYG